MLHPVIQHLAARSNAPEYDDDWVLEHTNLLLHDPSGTSSPTEPPSVHLESLPKSAMHMTVRRREGLPSFRQQRVRELLHALMRKKNDDAFQIVHYSIQSNHIHLISEARDRRAVTRKMHGFMVAFAKRLNAMLSHAGKHGAVPAGSRMPDIYSTALLFDGWEEKFLVYGFDDWPQPRPRTRMLRSWWRSHEPLRLLQS